MRRFLLVGVAVLAVACKGSKSSDGAGSATAGSATGVGSAAAGSATDVGAAPDAGAGSAATGSGDGSAGSAAAGSAGGATDVQRSPEVAALEAALVALVNEPEGDARSRKTCAQLMDLQKKARAVARNLPAGVDAAAWQAANEDISGSLHGLGPYCTDDPPDDSIELPGLYANFQRLLTLLPKAP